MTIDLTALEWLDLFSHYMWLSLLSVGGAISTVPEMHRFLVVQNHWLTEAQFYACISIAQAAPGPNVLFVGLMGWTIGMNAGGFYLAPFGLLVTMLGIMLPSSTITYWAARWAHQNNEQRIVRSFKQGMAPVVMGLLLATGWILSSPNGTWQSHWPLWLLTVISALMVWLTRFHMLALLAIGAAVGAMGWLG
jgi:chromate transporter